MGEEHLIDELERSGVALPWAIAIVMALVGWRPLLLIALCLLELKKRRRPGCSTDQQPLD